MGEPPWQRKQREVERINGYKSSLVCLLPCCGSVLWCCPRLIRGVLIARSLRAWYEKLPDRAVRVAIALRAVVQHLACEEFMLVLGEALRYYCLERGGFGRFGVRIEGRCAPQARGVVQRLEQRFIETRTVIRKVHRLAQNLQLLGTWHVPCIRRQAEEL